MTDQPVITTAAPAPLHDASASPQSQANAAIGLFGITGAGKTRLAITGVEEAWEVYHKITHWYASDLGGWGTKLLSLIKLGIVRVWYLRNHHNPFETMDLASQGYWPAAIADRDTGLAAPDVKLIASRRLQWELVCPAGHDTGTKYDNEGQAGAVPVTCAVCGALTSMQNARGVKRIMSRPKLFQHVGHYVYDSMTQMSEYGAIALQEKSAYGKLGPKSPLSSADAFTEGEMTFGSGSQSQVGFMQNRVPGWIGNIRAIPDQVLPPVITFGVEQSKGDDESGGIRIMGPKIAGNARTSSVPGWLGNCLYVAKEPHALNDLDAITGSPKLYHRLWLTTHVDPRDMAAIPIVAKHRGEPLGMPQMLEDPYISDPMDPAQANTAGSRCSLRVFYRLLRDQQLVLEARDREKFGDVAALLGDGEDAVVEAAVPETPIEPVRGAAPAGGGGRSRFKPAATVESGVPMPAAPVAAPQPEQPAAAPTVLQKQLEASLAERTAAPATAPAAPQAPAAPAAPAASSQAPPLAAASSLAIRRNRTPRPPTT